jgi:poly(A) polymerase
MIRRLLARFLPRKNKEGRPRVYGPGDHPVRRQQITRGALEVTRKLHEAGFKAFVVGGAVRDLLLGIKPKDFDIATDARPEDIKPLFRRAFIIGRRFRLVHVHVGSETIEVSTFRAAQTGDDTTDEHGRLLTDNVYGSQMEDATRRDFTINALYFDPAKEEVWDFVGGVADIRARELKADRRADDAAARGSGADAAGGAPRREAQRRDRSEDRRPDPEARPADPERPAARLFDEMQKLLLSGHAVETLKSLRAHGLSHGLLPMIDVILEQPLGTRFIDLALADTDLRVRDGRGVSPGFLFATLLWHEVLATVESRSRERRQVDPALFEAMDTVLAQQAKKIAIPRRFEATIKEIWSLQPRFEQRSGQRPHRLLQHPRFRAGWDFLDLRCRSGELEGELAELASWWDRFANADAADRDAMLKPDTGPKRSRRGRGRGRKREERRRSRARQRSPAR